MVINKEIIIKESFRYRCLQHALKRLGVKYQALISKSDREMTVNGKFIGFFSKFFGG
jgi:hypothetical protein